MGSGRCWRGSRISSLHPSPYIDVSKSNGPGTGYVTFDEELGYGSILPKDAPQRDKVNLEMDTVAFALIQQAIADRVA